MEKDQTWENTVAIMWEKIWPKSNLSLDSLQNENNSVKLLKIWILTNSRVHKSDFDEILGIRIAQMFIFAQFKSEYLILDNFQSAKIWLWRFLRYHNLHKFLFWLFLKSVNMNLDNSRIQNLDFYEFKA